MNLNLVSPGENNKVCRAQIYEIINTKFRFICRRINFRLFTFFLLGPAIYIYIYILLETFRVKYAPKKRGLITYETSKK